MLQAQRALDRCDRGLTTDVVSTEDDRNSLAIRAAVLSTVIGDWLDVRGFTFCRYLH